MINLHMCFTPFQIQTSNWLTQGIYKDDENIILSFSATGLSSESLTKYINRNYKYHKHYDINLETPKKITEIVKKRKKNKLYIKEIFNLIDKLNVSKIVYYSDQFPIYQEIFSKYKGKIKLVFGEDGTARYQEEYKYKKSIKIKSKLYQGCLGFKNYELFTHGYGGFENTVILREPSLVKFNNKTEIIQITKNDFIDIIQKRESNFIYKGDIFCPTHSVFEKKEMLEIYKCVFDKYKDKENILYVKLHPAEKHQNEIENLILKYKNIILIKDTSITVDEIILNADIKKVISDISTSMINAYYLKEKIEIVTYLNLIDGTEWKKKYKNIRIFDSFQQKRIIKEFE